jgi:hypothetical protein
LRERGLLRWRGQRFRILRPAELRALAEFDPNYLHLDGLPKGAGFKSRAINHSSLT